MNNFKRILTSTLVIAVLAFTACSDDDSSPKKQFSFDGETVTLKGANLYLTYDGNAGNGTHLYRDYFISDGTYTNADGNDGWSMEDYENATYFLAIELATPLEDEIGPGEFPQWSNWTGVETNISYIYYESGDGEDEVEYYTDSDTEDNSPVIVSGGVEDGDTMTLKFSGKLKYYFFDGTNWVEETVSGKFYFKGEVKDEREIEIPSKRVQKIHGKGHH
jgi:hypothetical protein